MSNLYSEVMFPQLVVFIGVALNDFKNLDDQDLLQLNQNQNFWNYILPGGPRGDFPINKRKT